jgi:hypothetical protein
MACRIELERRYPLANGRVVIITLRDSVTVEDPYLLLVRAKALSIRTGEPISANATSKTIKDYLIKTNISI